MLNTSPSATNDPTSLKSARVPGAVLAMARQAAAAALQVVAADEHDTDAVETTAPIRSPSGPGPVSYLAVLVIVVALLLAWFGLRAF